MYKGRIVDVDVHNSSKARGPGTGGIADYLADEWKDYVRLPDSTRSIALGS